MGGHWAVVPISLLACGFLAVLIYERFLDRPAPSFVSVAPTFGALIVTVGLFFSSAVPFTLTLFSWSFPETAAPSLSLAYYVDAWGSLLAALALFLGLCGQLTLAIGNFSMVDGNEAVGAGSERTTGGRSRRILANWDQILILAVLLILLNLVFAASLIAFFVSWCALGFMVYATSDSGSGKERELESVPGGTKGAPAALKLLAAFGLLGVVIMLSREGDGAPLAMALRPASLGLASSVLVACAVGSFLGLFPFVSWPRYDPEQERYRGWPQYDPDHGGYLPVYRDRAEREDWQALSVARRAAVTMPIGLLPALAAVYFLGRLYPILMAHSAPAFSSILGLMGTATVLVAAARAWQARSPSSLFSALTAIEFGLVAIAFALSDLHAFPAALFVFLNCALATQSIALGDIRRFVGASSQASSSLSLEGGEDSWSLLLALPALSLIGLPFTLGFIARWMLLAANSDLRMLVLWPVVAVAGGVGVVATLRLLERILSIEKAKVAPGPAASAVESRVDRRANGVARTVILLPWIVSLALGLIPNQVAQWIVAPAAGALLGNEYGQLFAARMALPGGFMTAIALAWMLGVIILAVYVYPLPVARLVAKRFSPADGDREGKAASIGLMRHRLLEAILDLAAMTVLRVAGPDGALERGLRGLGRVSVLVGRLHDSFYEDYCFPSLAVLGFVILFLFLG